MKGWPPDAKYIRYRRRGHVSEMNMAVMMTVAIAVTLAVPII